MLNILTGLPKNKNNDHTICNKFANSIGTKIILGSSTMKMYCRELNIVPEIKICSPDINPIPKYFINGIDIASEGVITLNECYKILSENFSTDTKSLEIVNLLKKEKEIHFIVGTADNGEYQVYKQNNLLPRTEIVKKIIELLKDKKITTEFI